MAKWSNVTSKDLRKGVVQKLSLEATPSKRGREPIYWYSIDGKKELRITIPNIHGGSGSISTGFLTQIRKDLMLDTRQFEELVDCFLSTEEYEKVIRKKLGIPPKKEKK